jgi:hypothetical protein
LAYAIIGETGELTSGTLLSRTAAATISRTCASVDAPDFATLPSTKIAELAARLQNMLAETSVILSCEGWLERAEEFASTGLLSRLGAPVEIVAYLRPQADYLNANWWQWGAWTHATYLQWRGLTGPLRHCCWGRMLREWSAMDGVTAVRAKLLPQDVISEFFSWLAYDPPESIVLNKSLPSIALRFLQRNRELRPHAHACDIDFVLQRALDGWRGGAPWVMPLEHVAYVLDKCREDNLALKDMLDPEDQASMAADPRWWTASAYADRIVEPPEVQPLEAAEMEAFALALARALNRAEKELVALKASAAAEVDQTPPIQALAPAVPASQYDRVRNAIHRFGKCAAEPRGRRPKAD